MSLGFGPKIYLCGAMPLYSYMVALATDLLYGGVSHLDLFLYLLSLWERAHVWSYLDLFAFLQT
jgi:hypothetical protein